MRYHFTPVKMASFKIICKQVLLKKVWREGNTPILLVGMKIGQVTMENTMQVL